MAISKGMVASVVAAFIVGAALGAVGGGYFGAMTVLSLWVQEQAADVKSDIAVIRQLRGGNAAQATEMLEARLDDDLIVLEPEGYHLSKDARASIVAAVGDAKKYRAEHPRKSSRTHVDAMVGNVLK
jgi:hypothetical protein